MVVILYIVGIIIERKMGLYVPLGNPLKYLIWFCWGVLGRNI